MYIVPTNGFIIFDEDTLVHMMWDTSLSPDAWRLLIPKPYDVAVSWGGTPTAASQLIHKTLIGQEVLFAADFALAAGHVDANPAGDYTCTVKDDGVSIGTVVIGSGGAFTFATVGNVAKTVAAGSSLTVEADSSSPPDGTISNIAFTLLGDVT